MPTPTPFKSQLRKPLPGSEKAAISTLLPTLAAHVTPRQPEKISITVILHPRRPVDPSRRLTRDEFASEYAPDPAGIKLLESFAEEFGLHLQPHPTAGPRSFSVSGSETALSEAFGVTLTHHELNGHTLRVREGTINLRRVRRRHHCRPLP